MKPETPAVAYIRMSSGKQEASPEQQRAAVAKLAKRLGYKIIREYFDSGISGDDTDRRVEFQRMIADAEERKDFSAICCWDQDRFGRFDSIEAGRWIYPLRQCGVWLATVSDGVVDWSDFAGRMVYSIKQEGKHQYLVDLSHNVCRGMLSRMQAGTVCPGPVYGYDRVFYDETGHQVRRVPYTEPFTKPERWTAKRAPADDGSADIVRWMGKRFLEDACGGIHSIVCDLNRRGIPGPRGRGKWNWAGVKYILTNPVYAGLEDYGRYSSGKYHNISGSGEVVTVANKSRRTTKRGKGAFLRKGTHEALIDPDTFQQIQERLQERAVKRVRPRKSDYLLSGILFCGHCGGRLYGAPGGVRGEDGTYSLYYYICETGTKRGKSECEKYSVRKDQLERYVLDVVYEAVTAPAAIQQVVDAVNEFTKQDTVKGDVAASIQAQVKSLDAKIRKASENILLADPAVIRELTGVLQQWRQQRAALQARLEIRKRVDSHADPARVAAAAIGELAGLRELLESADKALVRKAVGAIVEKITLWWSGSGKSRRVSRGVLEFNCKGIRGIPR